MTLRERKSETMGRLEELWASEDYDGQLHIERTRTIERNPPRLSRGSQTPTLYFKKIAPGRCPVFGGEEITRTQRNFESCVLAVADNALHIGGDLALAT